MEIKGSLTAKSIISAGLRVNEGCNTQTLLGDTSLSKYSKKTQYYFTQQDCIVTLPDATTLPTGWTISFFSNKLSSGTVFIHDTAGAEQYKVKPNKSVSVILLENTTAAGIWRVVESGSGTGAGDRNITILAEDPLFAVEGTAVNVNRFVASVSNGFEEDGTAIEEIIEFPGGSALTNPESFPKTSYVYLTIEGMLIQEDKKQDGGNEFPESPEDGDIFYNKQLRKNFKYEGSEWVDYPCVAVGEVTWNSESEIIPTTYTFNDWWWDYVELTPLVSHVQQFVNNDDVTTQITLDTKCLDKNYLTINVGNTVLLSDTYDLASDGVTVSFINAIEPGVKIEAKWYIPIAAASVTTTGANTDLSNLTAVGNEKLLPMGGNIGDVVIRTAEGARWAAPTGMTIGTVFISDLVAPYNPPGALEYNGTEVTNADQQYPEFWNTWLTMGKFATGTYAQYADAVAANGGTCPFYAIDVSAKKFKTPTWADGVFPSSAASGSEVNKYKPAGLPNITASTEGLAPCSNPTGAFTVESSGLQSLDGNANRGTRLKFDASNSNSIYGSSTTVQPVSVRKRWFVQVSNAVETTAYQNIDIALNSKVNKSGDTMTGTLVVNKTRGSGQAIQLVNSAETGNFLEFARDSSSPLISRIYTVSSENNNVLNFQLWGNESSTANGENSLSIVRPRQSGSAQVLCNTPVSTANDKQVATTAWVRNYIVGFPNFSAGITIDALDPSTYTAPSNGWVHFVTSGGSDGRNTLKINGTQVYYQANQGSGASASSCFLPVKKGDKIKLTKSGGNPIVETQKFYPSI